MFEKEITFDRFIRGLMVVAGLALAIYVLNLLKTVLLPFFMAWFLAYMIYPTIKFFQYKLHFHNRILCIAVTLSLILATIVGFFWVVIPPVISEFVRFRGVVAGIIKETGNSALAHDIEAYLQRYIDQNSIVQLFHENNILEALKVAANQLWSLLTHTFSFIMVILNLCITLLYLIFILLDYEKLSEGWIRLIPKRSRRFASALANDVQHGMNSYFRGQAFVAFLVGVLFSTGFLIIDFPLAIGLGMFIGFLNLVPYMQVFGFIPTILLAFLKANDTGESFWLILLSACIVFIVVQTIQDAFLVPKIMGKLMGLNPAVILLSLSVWGYLLGLIGLIIALPLTTLLLSYYHRFIERDERKVILAEERLRKRHLSSQELSSNSSDSLPPVPATPNRDGESTPKEEHTHASGSGKGSSAEGVMD